MIAVKSSLLAYKNNQALKLTMYSKAVCFYNWSWQGSFIVLHNGVMKSVKGALLNNHYHLQLVAL